MDSAILKTLWTILFKVIFLHLSTRPKASFAPWARSGMLVGKGYLSKGFLGGYPSNGYPRNGYSWNGYPRNGYPRNGYPRSRYPQCTVASSSYLLSVSFLWLTGGLLGQGDPRARPPSPGPWDTPPWARGHPPGQGTQAWARGHKPRLGDPARLPLLTALQSLATLFENSIRLLQTCYMERRSQLRAQ